jgi:hypothetical protein
MSGPTTQDDRLERIEQRLEELLDVLVFIEGRLSWLEQLGKPYHRSLPEGRNDEAYARNQQLVDRLAHEPFLRRRRQQREQP